MVEASVIGTISTSLYPTSLLWWYKIELPTAKWYKLIDCYDVAEQFNSFHQENIFGEEDDCLHELLKEAKKFKEIQHCSLSLEEWKSLFRNILVDEDSDCFILKMLEDLKKNNQRNHIAELGIKLAKTNSITSFDTSMWKSDHTFQDINSNQTWGAAYTLFGETWTTDMSSWQAIWDRKDRDEKPNKKQNSSEEIQGNSEEV